jgi:quercetin dioxygenase-like cupin family protein
MATTTTVTRRIHNPVQGDSVTFLETSAESAGERTLCLFEVAPGGRVKPHFHMPYSEHFFVSEGQLTVTIGEETHELGPGEDALVGPGLRHAWRNDGAERVMADLELRPGHTGFEDGLRILFGLATDGRVMADGLPRNPLHTAVLLELGELRLPGALGAVRPLFGLLARVARRTGVERELRRRYLGDDTA